MLTKEQKTAIAVKVKGKADVIAAGRALVEAAMAHPTRDGRRDLVNMNDPDQVMQAWQDAEGAVATGRCKILNLSQGGQVVVCIEHQAWGDRSRLELSLEGMCFGNSARVQDFIAEYLCDLMLGAGAWREVEYPKQYAGNTRSFAVEVPRG